MKLGEQLNNDYRMCPRQLGDTLYLALINILTQQVLLLVNFSIILLEGDPESFQKQIICFNWHAIAIADNLTMFGT